MQSNICGVTHPGRWGFSGSSWAQGFSAGRSSLSHLVGSKNISKNIWKKRGFLGNNPGFFTWFQDAPFQQRSVDHEKSPETGDRSLVIWGIFTRGRHWKVKVPGIVHIGKCQRQSRCDQKGKTKSRTFHTNSTFSHLASRNNYRLIWQENPKRKGRSHKMYNCKIFIPSSQQKNNITADSLQSNLIYKYNKHNLSFKH